MARKVPDEVQRVFDDYTVNFVRRLNRDKAREMFQTVFGLNKERADFMFDTFKGYHTDQLSIWEFYHFYTSFGYDANKYLDEFNSLQTDGNADISGTKEFLKQLKTMSGRCLSDTEVDQLIKGKAGEENVIDQKKFTELICRIKMTRTKD